MSIRESKEVGVVFDELQKVWREFSGEPVAPLEHQYIHAAQSRVIDPLLAGQEELISGQ